jgi:hypothetical protein
VGNRVSCVERFVDRRVGVDSADLWRASPDTPDRSLTGAGTNLIFREREHYVGIEYLLS